MRHMLEDPANLTPDQRRGEIAAILARGVLRLRQCTEMPAISGLCEKDPDSGRDCLDESATSSPHVHAG